MEKEKICTRCKRSVTLGSYYRNKENKNGLHSYCIDCCREQNLKRYSKERWDEYYKNDKERRDKYQLEYYKKNKEKVSKRCHEYNQKHRAHQNEKHLAWKAKHPDAVKAHSIVYEALKDGRLTKLQFCECCLREGYTESHHEDYSFPLNVVWLCRSHHRRYHKNNSPDISEKIREIYKKKFNKQFTNVIMVMK